MLSPDRVWHQRRRQRRGRRAWVFVALALLLHGAVWWMARSSPQWAKLDAPLPTVGVQLLPPIVERPAEPTPVAEAPPPAAVASRLPPPRTEASRRASADRANPRPRPAKQSSPPVARSSTQRPAPEQPAAEPAPLANDTAPVDPAPAIAEATPADPLVDAAPPVNESHVSASDAAAAAEVDAAGVGDVDAAGEPEKAGADAADEPVAPRYGRPLLEPARSGELHYALHYGDYTSSGSLARVKLAFEVDGEGNYQLWTEGTAIGLTSLFYSGSLTQVSRGRITQDGLQPLAYDEKRGKRALRHLEVEWQRGVVMLPEGRTAPAPPDVQDRLSTLMQLSLLARTQPDRFAPGLRLQVPEMNFGGVEPIAYRSEGYVTLPTPQGPLHAIHLVRERSGKPNEPKVEIWLGYEQAMLPIRLRMTDRDGQVLDQIITR